MISGLRSRDRMQKCYRCDLLAALQQQGRVHTHHFFFLLRRRLLVCLTARIAAERIEANSFIRGEQGKVKPWLQRTSSSAAWRRAHSVNRRRYSWRSWTVRRRSCIGCERCWSAARAARARRRRRSAERRRRSVRGKRRYGVSGCAAGPAGRGRRSSAAVSYTHLRAHETDS